MSNITLGDFFTTDFVNYSSYDNLRKIPSVCDGLKNASRKIVSTLLDKHITEPLKVSQLGAKVCEYRDYLHGSLDAVIVTLGQSYTGSNNLPLVQSKGNFGTRLSPEASASRYIFASGSKELFKLFSSDDDAILLKQTFEGYPIEPRYYLPALPILLINGAEGISSGFACKILPRNPKAISDYLGMILLGNSGENTVDPFTPWFKGFKGSIVEIEPNQWLISGVCEVISKNKVEITELPIGYSLRSYLAVLDKLEETKAILGYDDNSDGDNFNFIVRFNSKDLANLGKPDLIKLLKLTKTVTENFTVLDENNKIKVFNSARELFMHFFALKYQSLLKRKEHIIGIKELELSKLNNKARFIAAVLSNTIDIRSTIAKLNKELERSGYASFNGYDYLLKMPMQALTKDRVSELKQMIKDKQAELDSYRASSIFTIWFQDLS